MMRRTRLDSVDVLRGVVMILMALDHTRDFFGDASASPTDLATTTPALFATRWITHFCAPTFFLLSGVGAYLALARRGPAGLSRFLLTRGLWIVFLELTIARFLWQFNVDYRVLILNVLWALGWSMVALSLLVRLPVNVVGAIGLVMIAFHNAFDGVAAQSFGALAPVWNILHQPGLLVAPPKGFVLIAYPLVPWIGVMAAGFALGQVLEWPDARRRAFLLRAGLAITVGFVALRALDIYGDPRPWTAQATTTLTWISFFNTNKYPPSLLFLMMTLGPALLFLRAMDSATPRVLRPALQVGRVPMFYYLMHILLLHAMAIVLCAARFGTVHWMFESPSLDKFPVTQPPGWPLSLPWVYLLWATVVVMLYPVCRWYGRYKAGARSELLSYL